MTVDELDALNIGELVDALYDMRQQQRDAKAIADAIGEDVSFIETYLLNKFGKHGLKSAQGTKAKVSITETEYPTVVNWDDVYNFIAETGSFDLLQKRIGIEAWKQRREDDVQIPGIAVFVKTKINMRST